MLGPCGHEREVACFAQVPLAIVNKRPSASNDQVDLVLFVWRLLPRNQGNRKSHIKRAASQHHRRVLARGAGDPGLSLGKTDNAATIWLAHASPLSKETLLEGQERPAKIPAFLF
jgi:hypothetical protein